jgi:alkylation response protein AidB-like acyl-CoA dehydrogenase
VIHVQLVEELLRLALESGAFDDDRVRPRLAQAAVEVRLFQLHNWRTLSRVARGEAPGPEGSALKLYWSEMSKRLHDTVMTVLGPSAPLWRGARDNPGDGEWQRSWLYYQASSIWAGTNEIQRNILGERVLGLPREPKPVTSTST